MHDAAVKGNLEVIEWIVNNAKMSTSIKDADGKKHLKNNFLYLQVLINIYYSCSEGNNIVHLASKYNHESLLDWINEREGIGPFKQQTFNGATCESSKCNTNHVSL